MDYINLWRNDNVNSQSNPLWANFRFLNLTRSIDPLNPLKIDRIWFWTPLVLGGWFWYPSFLLSFFPSWSGYTNLNTYFSISLVTCNFPPSLVYKASVIFLSILDFHTHFYIYKCCFSFYSWPSKSTISFYVFSITSSP